MQKKSHHNNNFGQLSMFFAITLLLVLTLIAFIVNVGLFVKAKINLQNAVDAAAWSGASVQAKQLTNIGYLNWEIRNVYKEWMFKYWVLGQISLNKTRLKDTYEISDLQKGPGMSFRMDPLYLLPNSPGYDDKAFDLYNIPSICIHFGKTGREANICEITLVPGLPRFETIEIPGISEHQEIFLNNIVEKKMADCSFRSNLNFEVAMNWAYGTGEKIYHGAPAIASNRPGAWPKAFELAVRMRNLEMFVNRPAIEGGICLQGNCAKKSSDLDIEYQELPINERPIKAFWSALRNLTPEMQANFTLYEIPPNTVQINEGTLSSYLIPSGANALTKQYLDLQIIPLNLVTFFTSFVGASSHYADTVSEAACAGSKTGMPIPGYIMGFTKNPQMLTYYSVKGETKFVGLFFPFKDRSGITIKAYASAKPFGGRIGPRLFNIDQDTQVTARKSSKQYRSLPYVIGMKIKSGTTFRPGFPIPYDQDFWVKGDEDILGGVPTAGIEPVFAIPNLLYDYDSSVGDFPDQQTRFSNPLTNAEDSIQISVPAANFAQRDNTAESAGLYDKMQFKNFASNITPPGPGTSITADVVETALTNSLRPTKYEALNYLIPTCLKDGEYPLDSVAYVPGPCFDNTPTEYTMLAPLYGNEALHKTTSDILNSVEDFLDYSTPAVDKFIKSLKKVSESIMSLQTVDPTGNKAAADSIWEPTLDCKVSMAGKFNQFFKGGVLELCGIKPLALSLKEHWSNPVQMGGTEFSRSVVFTYTPPLASYTPPKGSLNKEIMSGYMPGPRHGAAQDGEISFVNKLGNIARNKTYALRNFYSTKFVSTQSLTSSSIQPYPSYGALPFYQEDKSIGNIMSDIYSSSGMSFLNPLRTELLKEFGELTH